MQFENQQLNIPKKIAIENIEIRTLATEHKDPDTVGFKFFTPKFVLSYTADTAYKKELVDQYSKSDILILNHALPFDTKKPETLSSDDVIKIINTNPIYEAREIQKQTGVQVIAAEDGMAIDPISYSADLKQKTLNIYSKSRK